ncbi:DUF3426 domain-containing protein [Lysobacter enzymogenes]|uniref:DUF3426 domain-containing protein n=1 Tax=Lysobacter enzymogenes TaxID=69 RepID=UPI001AF782E3|nr:DUF3426 domain-containing protein [Lysobacter enzymogenes]QQQ00489.1 DUF3426 domain-containing protein [Lysobacter enzymogenes]
MFLACPHCGYLVALIVAKDGPARACPRCGGSLQSEAPSAQEAASAVVAVAAPVPDALVSDTLVPDASTPDASIAEPALHDAADAAPAAPQPAATPAPAPAPVRDEISLSLRRAPSAAPVRNETTNPAQTGSIMPASGEDRDDAGAGDDASDPTPPAAPPQPATDASENDAANPTDAPADATARALPPLTATPVAAAPARSRRQHKSETTVTSARRAPSFARQQARAQAPKPRAHWSGPAAIVALTLALALQLLLAQRAELAADARWRPLVSGLCGALGCTIPPWREPSALTMLNRNVLPVPERAGALRASAGFRNDARWPQPWPTLVLSLEDVDGRRVGQRAFAPGEYRRDHRPGELIAPGQSAAVQFEVLEPAPRVVAFTFDFR